MDGAEVYVWSRSVWMEQKNMDGAEVYGWSRKYVIVGGAEVYRYSRSI